MRSAAKLDKEQAAESAKESKSARKSAIISDKKAEKPDTATVQPRPVVASTPAAAATSSKPAAVTNSDTQESLKDDKDVKKSRFSLGFWRRGEPTDGVVDKRDEAVKPDLAAAPVPVKTPAPAAAKPNVAASPSVAPVAAGDGKRVDSLENAGEDAKPKKGGLFGWFGKKKEAPGDGESPAAEKPVIKTATKPVGTKSQSDDEDEAGTLVVEYVDAGLRIAQLFSAVYEAPEPPVPPPDQDIEASAADVAGVQLSANFDGYQIGVQYWDGQPFLSLHTPIKDETNTVFLSDSASYTSTLVYYDGGTIGDPHTPLSDAPTAPILTHSATYVLSIIPADSEAESATVLLGESSTYVLGAIGIPSSGDSSIVTLEPSLVYEPIWNLYD
jgi:hypothetical protein